MKTIYLREKKSGNFEFSNKENATLAFKTQKSFKEFYKSRYRYGKIIKSTYSKSQTYFSDVQEAIDFIKKNNIF